MLAEMMRLWQPEEISDPLPQPLSAEELQQSLSHEGDMLRLRCFVSKLAAGKPVSMAVLGGSVSAGSSSRVRPDQSGLFHRKVQRWLQRRYAPANVSHHNAAMPAVPPGYMEHCLPLHVPQDVDLVFLEAAANLCGHAGKSGEGACDFGRESVEKILRMLLRYPNRPAVLFVHA